MLKPLKRKTEKVIVGLLWKTKKENCFSGIIGEEKIFIVPVKQKKSEKSADFLVLQDAEND